MLIPVILTGGQGKRLWPMSRQHYPKAFLQLYNDYSLLQNTCLRTMLTPNFSAPIIIGQERHQHLIQQQLDELNLQAQHILLEPFSRNTGPAIMLAAFHLQQLYPDSDAHLVVFPIDHWISDAPQLMQQLTELSQQLDASTIGTLGIQPTENNSNYGYIIPGAAYDSTHHIFHVNQFKEKPDSKTIDNLFHQGDCYWNAGIFVIPKNTLLQQMQNKQPELYQATKQAYQATIAKHDSVVGINETYQHAPDISIDYAIMEHAQSLVVTPICCQWQDLGSWNALHHIEAKDDHNNVIKEQSLALGVHNSYLRSNHQLLVAYDIDDIIAITHNDVTLITRRETANQVDQLLAYLKDQNYSEAETSTHNYRPWGEYQIIEAGSDYQVKRLTIYPYQSISLQTHQYRSEHWTVVKGEAEITLGEQVFHLKRNESTYVALGVKHRIHNPKEQKLEIIETQIGDYLGEDDIVRHEDRYSRV